MALVKVLNPAFYGGAQNNNKMNADKSKKASKNVTTETKKENQDTKKGEKNANKEL